MTEYKNLSKFEKFEEFKELSFSDCERHNAAIYLKALWLNDKKTLDFYESFGEDPDKFLMNKRTYDKAQEFGFTEYTFNENGWIEIGELLELEEIPFHVKSTKMNRIEVGRGPNGFWTFGYGCSNNEMGNYSSASIWGCKFKTKADAIQAGVEYMKNFHTKAQSNISSQIIKMCDEKLKKEEPQLQLF